ncbi:MAG: hypothetical protein ACTHMR_21565 [Thermomicrobiales bacterium]
MTKRHIVDVPIADLSRRTRRGDEVALCGLLCPGGEYVGRDEPTINNPNLRDIYCKTCLKVRDGAQRPGAMRIPDARTHLLAKWQAESLMAHCAAVPAPEDQGESPATWGVKLEYRGKHVLWIASCLPTREVADAVVDAVHVTFDALFKIKE